MLIAEAAPLDFNEEQISHTSFQVTVVAYRYMIPGVVQRYVGEPV